MLPFGMTAGDATAARVPVSHTEDGYPLGTWVNDQRKKYRTDRLSPERIAFLESFPGWVWNPQDASWEEGFAALERFVAREGDARIPNHHMENGARERHARVTRGHREDGYPLGSWATTQFPAYRAGRLSPDRIARLKELPGWVWNPLAARWEEGFAALERFVAGNGSSGRGRRKARRVAGLPIVSVAWSAPGGNPSTRKAPPATSGCLPGRRRRRSRPGW